LHNVAETVPAEWDQTGDRLCRVPADVGAELNEMASERVRHPTGSGSGSFRPTRRRRSNSPSLRSSPRRYGSSGASSSPGSRPRSARSPRRSRSPFPSDSGNSPRATERDASTRGSARIRFERRTAAAIHDVAGDCRPPTADELPDHRHLAYGTSITEGAAASATHTDYVTHVARECGFDALNFRSSGSAYCEAAMAEYIASRGDWDVATLALSVNMANTGGFEPAVFHDRAETFVDTIAAAHPDKPIACVTLFPYFDDLVESGDADHAAAYRESLRSIVAESPHDNLSIVDGPELMEVSGWPRTSSTRATRGWKPSVAAWPDASTKSWTEFSGSRWLFR